MLADQSASVGKSCQAEFGDENTNTNEVQERLREREKSTNSKNSESQTDELDTLRDRYARGELTEEQFESKVETLLETDTPEDAANWQSEDREAIRE
nr:SHOCT domain-containing protein [Halococcus thailandensis]